MKFSELENQERQRQEKQQLLDLLAIEEQLVAEAEATEEFRQKVIAWMVTEGDLDADELSTMLSVISLEHMRVRLSVPEHESIDFRLRETDGKLRVRDGRFIIAKGKRDARALGHALIVASEEWQGRVQQEAEEAKRKAEHRAERELRDQYAAERGAKYLDLLNDYPILRPILDILGAFLEEREQFAEDLAMTEEFVESVEANYLEALCQAKNEAASAESERDRLRRDLYDTQDELDKEKRRGKRGR